MFLQLMLLSGDPIAIDRESIVSYTPNITKAGKKNGCLITYDSVNLVVKEDYDTITNLLKD